MKQVLSFFIILLIMTQLSYAQSITLSPSDPGSPTKGTVLFDNTTNLLKYWNGTGWIPITNAAAGTGWALSGNDIYNANTGNIGVGTTAPKATFNVAEGKTVIFGDDSLGTGNKLIWYPSKAAFRVGHVGGDLWDYNNVALYSTAMGTSQAYGEATTAMGISSAHNYASTAMGNSIANGYASTAMGTSQAYGFASTTMGYAIFTNSDYATAMGSWNVDVANALLMVGNGTGAFTKSNALTVLKDGKVGVGINNPEQLLDLNGRMRIRHNGSTAGIWMSNSANGFTGSDGAFIGMNTPDAGSETAGIWIGGAWRFWVNRVGNGFLNGNLIQTSDKRLKKDFSPLSHSLANIDKLTGYHFKWMEEVRSKDLQTGLIAQEVQKIFPELVQVDNKGFLSVNYIGLIPHLVESIKTLKQENDSLKERLTKIEAFLKMSEDKTALKSEK